MVAINNKQKRYNIVFLKVSEEEKEEREGRGKERERKKEGQRKNKRVEEINILKYNSEKLESNCKNANMCLYPVNFTPKSQY